MRLRKDDLQSWGVGKGDDEADGDEKNEGRGMKEEDEENKRTKEGGCLAYWGDREDQLIS